MVALDFSYLDEALIRYTNSLCRLLRPEVLYFVHVYKDLEDIDGPLPTRENYNIPPDELLVRQMQEATAQLLSPDCATNIHFEVKEGQPTEELLRWSRIKQIDLFVFGLKMARGGSGIGPQRVAMLSDCSVLLVPEMAPAQLNTILLPVDFSKFSQQVVLSALALQQQIPGAKLLLQHVYEVPIGYYKTGKTFDQFAEIMRFNATKAYYQFCRELNIPQEQLPCRFVLNPDGNIQEGIMESIREVQPSLLLIGSQGRTAVSSFFIGSVAEKLIRLNPKIPTLVLKRKGSNMGLLDALFPN